REVNHAVVIGAGFIGLEIYENLMERGLSVQLIEARTSLMPALDDDMRLWLEDYFSNKNLPYALGEFAAAITSDSVLTQSGKSYRADMVIVAAGVRPEVSLAEKAGIELGVTGAVKVDDSLNTSLPHIKAVGDCAEMFSPITGKALYRPMGSTANKTGRIAGDSLTGGDLRFRGVLGTGIVKVFDLHIGFTGLTQSEAEAEGYDVEVIHNIKENQSKYLPESREMIIKAVADRSNSRLLGVQIIGERGVDKRLDVFATAITFAAGVDDLFHLDLCYAPPFSTTKDPVMYTGMILSNAIKHDRKIITPSRLLGHEQEYQIIDVRSQKDYEKGHIKSALNIPLAELRDQLNTLDKKKPTITHCNKGVTGNAAQNLLINSGFNEVYNISGGFKNYKTYKKYRS
ncbi:MAG: FAD-dependent oxidoreductase, partial [Spirochaetales bacterium]|nr:FAD-dependent oxidoreductase [Spirochaetales bacterium]